MLPAAVPCFGAPQAAGVEVSAPPPAFSAFHAVRPTPDLRELQELQAVWADILARHDPEKAFGNAVQAMPPPVLAQWRNLSRRMPAWTATEKLQNINGFFNRWPSKSDLENYGVEEYWALPEEFLEKGGGDCEDYAIIKFLALRYFGWPKQDIWLVLGKENKNKRGHAVLAARAGERLFILDNLSRPAHLLIPEEQYMRNFTPLYAMNELGAWVFEKPGAKPSADKLSH